MDEPKGPLFHYTSIQGLIGILTERKIWATNISHLNDKQELFEARDMFRDEIKLLIEKVDPHSKLPRLAIPPRDYQENPKIPEFAFLEMLDGVLGLAERLSIFVCSFSEEGDQLSQWRGYCPNAYGFSVGFNYNHLKKRAEQKGFMLKECVYERDQQQQIVNEYVRNKIMPRLSDLVDKVTSGKHGWETFREILEILPMIKNKHFAEEKEWRLISSVFSIPRDAMKFRPGKTAIIPYCEFELEEDGNLLPIDRIIIGPTPSRTESLLSLQALLNKIGMQDKIEIDHSAIPYREI